MVGRATSCHIRYPDIALGYAAAGLRTKMYFYEAAAFVLSCVTSGYGSVQTVHPGKAVIDDGVTPLEAHFCAELAHTVAGMKAEQANELVNRLLVNYEKNVENPPSGKRYQECYDLKTGKSSDEYLRLYDEVKEELDSLGITMQ